MDNQLKTFIRKNIEKNSAELALQYSGVSDIPVTYALNQIKARQKARQKLPSWYKNDDLIFPPALSIEQCSSEITAEFKARNYSGNSFLDLTGGTGVDTLSIGSSFDELTYVEPDGELCNIFSHNATVFNKEGITIINRTAEAFLSENDGHYDLIYVDPSRRDEQKQRVYDLEHCLPNCIELMPELLQHSDRILIKASPMIDIKHTLQRLQSVHRVQCVAVNNEMKELLFHIRKGHEEEAVIEAWNLNGYGSEQSFMFSYSEEKVAMSDFSAPCTYIYDMNVALMKAGAFKSTAKKFELLKLHPHTHLYTSKARIKGFPGRTFKLERVLKPSKKEILKAIKGKKANVATRNYPSSAADIKKKYGLSDGGDTYAFFCEVLDAGFLCLICSRIS